MEIGNRIRWLLVLCLHHGEATSRANTSSRGGALHPGDTGDTQGDMGGMLSHRRRAQGWQCGDILQACG